MVKEVLPLKRAVSFVVPALNEEKQIGETVREICQAAESLEEWEIILVNDGSTDATAEIMKHLCSEDERIKMLSHDNNRGMGAAYKSGLVLASCPYYMLIPGDNGFTAKNIQIILDKLGSADIIIPYHENMDSVRSWQRKLISRAFTGLANFCAGLDVPYYNGTVVHKTELLKTIDIETDSFAYQLEALVKLLQLGYGFETVGINVQERQEGNSKAFRLHNIVQVVTVFIRLLMNKIL